MSDWQETLTDDERDALKKTRHPEWMSPMLACFLGLRRDKNPREVTRESVDG